MQIQHCGHIDHGVDTRHWWGARAAVQAADATGTVQFVNDDGGKLPASLVEELETDQLGRALYSNGEFGESVEDVHHLVIYRKLRSFHGFDCLPRDRQAVAAGEENDPGIFRDQRQHSRCPE